jgi:hypothetical protein
MKTGTVQPAQFRLDPDEADKDPIGLVIVALNFVEHCSPYFIFALMCYILVLLCLNGYMLLL